MDSLLLTDEEIEEQLLPVLKDFAETLRVLGKRFIDADITYKEYQRIGLRLSEEYELSYRRTIAQAQMDKIKKAGWVQLDENQELPECVQFRSINLSTSTDAPIYNFDRELMGRTCPVLNDGFRRVIIDK